MRVTTIVPHGDIPDRRGFAPAIVAQELATRYQVLDSSFIALQEQPGPLLEWWRESQIRRYREGRLYQRLFRKWTRLDPWPLERRLVPLVEALRPNLVHVHQLEFPVSRFRSFLKRQLPVVLHAHAQRSFDPARGIADAYVAVSQYTREQMVARGGYPPERVEVVHNGVDTLLFHPPDESQRRALRKLMGIPEGALVLGYVGRRQAAKGYHRYLVLLHRLTTRNKDVHGVVVGPEPKDAKRDSTWSASRRLHDEMAADGRLLSLPALTHDKLRHLYQVMDLVVSMTSGEQFPVMVLEAMASGCCIVTTPVGGTPEAVSDGENGRLLPVDCSDEELIHAVLGLIDDPEQRLVLTRNARSTIEQQFSWQVLSRKMERLLFKLVRGGLE
jgi:glycosyltransferase involved in cell wall biosynthesis